MSEKERNLQRQLMRESEQRKRAASKCGSNKEGAKGVECGWNRRDR
jgi:hypothetical protein